MSEMDIKTTSQPVFGDIKLNTNNLDETIHIIKDAIVIKNECPLYKDVIKLIQEYCHKMKTAQAHPEICFVCGIVEKMK